jgi:hypothetical protein
MSQFSHCPVSPIFVLVTELMGLNATAPGFARFRLAPQLADLEDLDLTAYTVRGAFRFVSTRHAGGHQIEFVAPEGTEGELVLDSARTTLRGGQVHRFVAR